MKKSLLVLLLLAPAALLAASFEGKVNFKISAARGKTEEMSYQIKDGRFRIEVGGQKQMGGMIVDIAKKQTIMLMDEQRMYMVMDMPDVAAQAAQATPEDTNLEKTGEKTKILGYDAEKYIATSQGKKTDLWLAEGLGTFMAVPSGGPMGGGRGGRGGGGGGSGGQAWERALAGKDLFPLRVVSYDKGGKEETRMEVTAIEKKSLPDSLFAPPDGYQKFDMGGMMKGMMPGGFPGSRK